MTIKEVRRTLEQYDQRLSIRIVLYNDAKTVEYLKDLEPEDLIIREDDQGQYFLGIDGEV